MAAPTYGVAGTYRQGSSSTPAFAAPASVVSTSIVVLDFYLDAGATISSLPSGFAHVAGSPLTVNPGGGGEHKLCRIWARNPAGSTYTVTLSANVYTNGMASRVDGCVTSGDPWDTNSGTGTALATATDISSGTTPAVSMTTQNADQLLWFSGTNWGGGAWTPPTSFTERLDSGDQTLTVDTLAQAVAGSTGSVTATCVTPDRRAALIGSLLSTALGGGTTYNQSVSGGITPTAALVRQTGKHPAGGITPAGALVRQAAKRPAGSIAPAGALVRAAGKALAGGVTPSGALVRRAAKAFAGSVTPAGALSVLKAALRSFAGSITPSGALTRRTAKTLGGSIAPAGSLRRAVAKTLAGTLGTAGTLIKAAAKRFLGGITPTGAVTASTGPPPVPQDITLTVGAAELAWRAGPPGGRWTAGEPGLSWTAGPPEV